jgi:hypothetical protein
VVDASKFFHMFPTMEEERPYLNLAILAAWTLAINSALVEEVATVACIFNLYAMAPLASRKNKPGDQTLSFDIHT